MPITYCAWLKNKNKERVIRKEDVYEIDESTLEKIDKAVASGKSGFKKVW